MEGGIAEELRAFREGLTPHMMRREERPFICDGNPFTTHVFVVGFNPATTVERPFWSYWSDATGFDRAAFMADYLLTRKLKGVRPRIEAIVRQFPPGAVLETNICSSPAKRAADLRADDRRTEAFRYLLATLRPSIVFAHSNQPIEVFREITGIRCDDGHLHAVEWQGHRFYLVGRPGPLWRMSVADAEGLGQYLAASLQSI